MNRKDLHLTPLFIILIKGGYVMENLFVVSNLANLPMVHFSVRNISTFADLNASQTLYRVMASVSMMDFSARDKDTTSLFTIKDLYKALDELHLLLLFLKELLHDQGVGMWTI